MIFLVSDHIEVSGTGEAEDNVLRFAGLFAFEGLVDRDADRVGTLGCGKDALDAREHLRRFEDVGLFHGDRFHQAVVVQL